MNFPKYKIYSTTGAVMTIIDNAYSFEDLKQAIRRKVRTGELSCLSQNIRFLVVEYPTFETRILEYKAPEVEKDWCLS